MKLQWHRYFKLSQIIFFGEKYSFEDLGPKATTVGPKWSFSVIINSQILKLFLFFARHYSSIKAQNWKKMVKRLFWSFWAKRAKIQNFLKNQFLELFLFGAIVFFYYYLRFFGGKKPLWFSCQILLVSFAFYNQRFLFFTCLFALMFHCAKDSKCTLDWKKYLKTTKRSQNDLYWIFRLAI